MGNFSTAKAVTFLDIETTHLSPKMSAILEIAFITDWEDGKQDVWSTKIKPNNLELEYASPEALEICNYNDDGWEDAPAFHDIAREVARRLTWGPIVGHNIQFDLNHIRAVFNRYGWKEVDSVSMLGDAENTFKVGYPVIDTCSLAYLFSPSEKQNLNAIRENLGISTDGAHSALKDTTDCRQLFYEIVSDAATSMRA